MRSGSAADPGIQDEIPAMQVHDGGCPSSLSEVMTGYGGVRGEVHGRLSTWRLCVGRAGLKTRATGTKPAYGGLSMSGRRQRQMASLNPAPSIQPLAQLGITRGSRVKRRPGTFVSQALADPGTREPGAHAPGY